MKFFDILKRDEIKSITDNFTLIVAIPYIIGGLWQFIQLTDISMELVKFFSLTQLIIDGLLTLVQCSCLYLIAYFLSKSITDLKNKSEKKYALLGMFILLSCVGSGAFMAYQIMNDGNPAFIKLCMGTFILLFVVLFSFVMSHGISITGQIVFIFLTFSLIKKVTTGENKIENINIITNQIKNDYPKANLSYYNDQFLFFETNKGKEDNKIIIKKMEDIFEAEK